MATAPSGARTVVPELRPRSVAHCGRARKLYYNGSRLRYGKSLNSQSGCVSDLPATQQQQRAGTCRATSSAATGSRLSFDAEGLLHVLPRAMRWKLAPAVLQQGGVGGVTAGEKWTSIGGKLEELESAGKTAVLLRRQGLLPQRVQEELQERVAAMDPMDLRVDIGTAEGSLKQQAAAVAMKVPLPQVRGLIERDIAAAAKALRDKLHLHRVHVRVQKLSQTMCPVLHVDDVRLRILVTYCGAGTVVVDSAEVERSWFGQVVGVRRPPLLGSCTEGGEACGCGRAEDGGLEAGVGDMLFLKGLQYPGELLGGGLHRSPYGTDPCCPRLLLTVDDRVAL